jgi:3-hydroxyacyl-CoA dehydrogenase
VPPKKLVELFEAGKLGKKSGQGFYTWVDGKAQKVGAGDTANPELAQRMLKPLLDATQRLVQEGVVADAELADAGVIFGTGFAPYTGGPMNYLDRTDIYDSFYRYEVRGNTVIPLESWEWGRGHFQMLMAMGVAAIFLLVGLAALYKGARYWAGRKGGADQRGSDR